MKFLNIFNKVLEKKNPATYKNDYTLWPSEVYVGSPYENQSMWYITLMK